jgi:hypothetical protein
LLSPSLSLALSVYLSIFLSTSLSIYLSVYLDLMMTIIGGCTLFLLRLLTGTHFKEPVILFPSPLEYETRLCVRIWVSVFLLASYSSVCPSEHMGIHSSIYTRCGQLTCGRTMMETTHKLIMLLKNLMQARHIPTHAFTSSRTVEPQNRSLTDTSTSTYALPICPVATSTRLDACEILLGVLGKMLSPYRPPISNW